VCVASATPAIERRRRAHRLDRQMGGTRSAHGMSSKLEGMAGAMTRSNRGCFEQISPAALEVVERVSGGAARATGSVTGF
jgi:hypothetical protein